MAKKSKSFHYVDNKELVQELLKWKQTLAEWEEKMDRDGVPDGDRTRPDMSNTLGSMIIQIAEGLAMKPNFRNYEYLDEMICDGIENCILYVHNFNPEKSNNGFAYVTQILYYAYVRRIKTEKKHTFIKMKCFEAQDLKGEFIQWAKHNGLVTDSGPGGYSQYFRLTQDDISKFETTPKPKKKKKKASEQADLGDLME